DDFDLELLLLPPDDGGAPGGPFLQKADDIIDPWGNQFEILVPGNVNFSYDVISWGEDGESGGEDINADITQ
ncbi:MAG TPA: type II secretion system protein GspG, partial [Phycisphaerales bacterium]|nr:type II secretion system protein GspG [Phycisphaerales bacterium]